MNARNIIDRWPSRGAIAADAGRSPTTIHSWYHRNSIPGDVYVTLVNAAKRRGFSLSFEDLARSRADAPVRAGCKGQHPFPRALGEGDAADAPGEIGAAGRELHATQRNTDSSLRHVRPLSWRH